MIDGYTVRHSADDILDSKGQPTQTFMGVSLITSPRLRPCILDIVAINGRFLSFKIPFLVLLNQGVLRVVDFDGQESDLSHFHAE